MKSGNFRKCKAIINRRSAYENYLLSKSRQIDRRRTINPATPAKSILKTRSLSVGATAAREPISMATAPISISHDPEADVSTIDVSTIEATQPIVSNVDAAQISMTASMATAFGAPKPGIQFSFGSSSAESEQASNTSNKRIIVLENILIKPAINDTTEAPKPLFAFGQPATNVDQPCKAKILPNADQSENNILAKTPATEPSVPLIIASSAAKDVSKDSSTAPTPISITHGHEDDVTIMDASTIEAKQPIVSDVDAAQILMATPTAVSVDPVSIAVMEITIIGNSC